MHKPTHDAFHSQANHPALQALPCAPCPPPLQLLPLPSWAQQRPTVNWPGNWRGSRSYNLQLVERANATDRLYDVVFYGDSLVALIP